MERVKQIMKKIIGLIIISTVLCISLVACNSNSDQPDRTSKKIEDEKESKYGFESSDDVIKSYWHAMAYIDKSESVIFS